MFTSTLFFQLHPSARSGPSFSVSTFQSPTHSLTNISLSRSPFSSPFYSGRTVYGGASSMNTSSLFRKRVRTETSPPDVSVCVCVCVHVCGMGPSTLVLVLIKY